MYLRAAPCCHSRLEPQARLLRAPFLHAHPEYVQMHQEEATGELLLLRLVVEGLVQDAQARLAVHKAHVAATSGASKHDLDSLLTESELWRTISVVSPGRLHLCAESYGALTGKARNDMLGVVKSS